MDPRALLLAGTAALLATPAAAQVSDFRLQPAPTPTPSIIGPPAETPAPRPSPAPTAAPTAATAAPTPTPTPRIVVPPLAVPTPAPQRSARPAARPSAAAPAPATPTSAPTPAPTAAPGAVPSVLPSASATPTVPAPLPAYPAAPASAPEPAAPWWPWIVAAFLLGGATFAGLWWLRRRIGPVGALVVPEIERPRVPPPPPAPDPRPEPPAAAPAPAPVAAAAEPHPLHIAIELRKLTLSLMNATLGYRLTLTNTGPEPLEEIAIAADLIGAHGSLPREVLLANPATELPMTHLVAGLAAGESADVTGEVRVPLAELRPISQGRAQLFVPLARFRIGAAGQEPRCFTLVAGQPSPSGNGAIQPVRLDHGPRVYDGLAGRAF